MEYIECAFINTDKDPISIKRVGVDAKVQKDFNHFLYIEVTAVYRYEYPHPEAPEDAVIFTHKIETVGKFRVDSSEDSSVSALALHYAIKVVLGER